MSRCRILDLSPAANIGGATEVKPSPNPDTWEGVLQLPVTDGERPDPEMLTVSLNVVPPSRWPVQIGDDANVILLRGRIRWGSPGGRGGEAIVDWRHGARVSLECSILEIACQALGTNGPPLYSVGASVGYGSLGKAPPITLTLPAVSLVADTPSARIRLPPWAYKVEFLTTFDPLAIPGATLKVGFYTTDDGAASFYYLADAGDAEPIAIANGSEWFALSSPEDQLVTPMFYLAL